MNRIANYFSNPVNWITTALAAVAIPIINSTYLSPNSWPGHLFYIAGTQCIAHVGKKIVFDCLAAKKLEKGLNQWVEEAAGTPEHINRRIAANAIRDCFKKNDTFLSLSELNLTSLPPEIGQLRDLRVLDLGDNQLSSLPPEIGQLMNLRFLGLSDNQFSSLPAEIGQLAHLQTLDLENNQLRSLPAEIGQLAHLKKLILSFNELPSLPPEIGQFTNLKELGLSGNPFSLIPSEIDQLTNLQILHLWDNRLSSLINVFNLPSTCKIRGIFSPPAHREILLITKANEYPGPQFLDIEEGLAGSSPRSMRPAAPTLGHFGS